jgi:hypothetical protein
MTASFFPLSLTYKYLQVKKKSREKKEMKKKSREKKEMKKKQTE